MPDPVAAQDALVALAARLAEIAPDGWAQTCAGFAAHADEGDPQFTWVLIGAVNLEDRWGFGQFDLDDTVYDLAAEHRRHSGPPPWSTLEFRAGPDGWHADLGYDPQPDGAFAPEFRARLEAFGERWTAERGATPGAGGAAAPAAEQDAPRARGLRRLFGR